MLSIAIACGVAIPLPQSLFGQFGIYAPTPDPSYETQYAPATPCRMPRCTYVWTMQGSLLDNSATPRHTLESSLGVGTRAASPDFPPSHCDRYSRTSTKVSGCKCGRAAWLRGETPVRGKAPHVVIYRDARARCQHLTYAVAYATRDGGIYKSCRIASSSSSR
ncbi:hypothetical protein GGS23DRAFT_513080 [Durotheca rogersii]|uniref:uncharacterized protein n=1 Tax=Durotheca rogersii TaxID=419775 RepID=UPI00221E4B6C|nr:uncharacterized protein GGS23DRAFT_513080 [Durotheca rogersii]KAI5863761.1 hypothetical protein GGS23DRAFT_513080 [Durotheca rogersii]